MAHIIGSSKSENLLILIQKTKHAKVVETVEYEKDDNFTHPPIQWKNKDWNDPSIQSSYFNFFNY